MNMNKEYVQGFIDRCAEAGVDPEQLVKTAGGGKSMGDAIGRFMPRLLRGNKTEAELKAYNAARKKLWEAINRELFYKLLKEKKLNLSSGFGTIFVREIKTKEKKVFDRKKNEMVSKMIKGSKIVFRPGDTLKEFL